MKRAEQLKRWQDSETFREPGEPKRKSRKVLFSSYYYCYRVLLIFIVYLNPVIANCWQGFMCKSAPAQNFFFIGFTTDKNLLVLEHFLPNT